MAKIELKISDPKALDQGINESPVQMTYGDTDSPIVIDTETAFIECEAQGKSASIKQWMVDFGNHKMKLADDAGDGNYNAIDFVTAAGMVGQLVKEVGIATLQTLLSTLNVTYGVRSNDEPAPSSPPGNDVPTENSPDSPKEPDLPSPVNPDDM